MLTGDLSHFGALDVLGMLGASRASGALVLEGEGAAVIYCDGGDITFATTRVGSNLADVLVTARFLDADDWAEAAASDDPANALGRALAAKGADATRLTHVLQGRTEDAVFESALWGSGTFRFEPSADHVLGDAFRFPVVSLLAAVSQRRERWADIVGRFGSLDHVVLPAGASDDRDDDDALLLSRTQVRVLTAAARQVPVRLLAEELDLGLFGACEVIATLVDRGLLVPTDTAVAPVATAWADAPAGITFAHHDVAPIADLAPAAAVAAVNGYANGHDDHNGHDHNGSTNGHGLNGHGLNGHGLNGHGLNGHGLNGHGLNGHDDGERVAVAPNGAEFVAPGDAPARDLILRLLTAVKEL